MQRELAALKARIAELEASQNDTWLSERRAEEVKQLIHEVLSDLVCQLLDELRFIATTGA